MFMHFSCIRTFNSLYSDIDLCWYFSASLSLSLWLVYSMAPKKSKSAPSWNPLHSEASSFDPTPSHVRFHDEKVKSDYLENFSQQGIRLKRHVVLLDFSHTDLPTVIYSRGWESLCDILVTCPFMII